ncbi:putative exported protein [Aliivibrio wodanis]|uniref:Putative exported protein n=1 Tax=Aliivibrio wodanis TaxID=80852 RepID=A0A090IB83_9GAMM|nr:putative exported protein [Aliivibrio wodanis]
MPPLLFAFCLFLFSTNSSQAENLTNIQPNSTIKLTNKTASIFINPASLKTDWLLASHSIPVIDSGLRVEKKHNLRQI